MWLRVRADPTIKSMIGIGAILVLILGGLIALNDLGEISFNFIRVHWLFLLEPAGVGLFATIVAFMIGFALAIPLGIVRAFGPNWLRQGGTKRLLLGPIYGVVTGYAEAVRGTPVFVQIVLIEGLVAAAIPFPNVALWAGVIALTINTGGYQTEVFRAGFQSVGQGQIEAAKAIGMSPFRTFANVTLPQGLRIIVLPLANEWIGLFKASALLWATGVQELMWAMSYVGTTQNHPIDAFLMGSLLYLLIIIPLSRVITYIESRKRIPGLGTGDNLQKKFFTVRRPKRTSERG